MSQFVLKIIAAVTMLIDHAGLILFPRYEIFRIIGRLAFPIYAYCIAEGFFHTRNRLKYFMRIFSLGIICQIVYTVVEREFYLGILITFSFSIVIMYFTECLRVTLRGSGSCLSPAIRKLVKKPISHELDRAFSASCLALTVIAAFILCIFVRVDYGFFGIMLPVFTNLFPDKPRRFLMFSSALIALCIFTVYSGSPLQLWSLFALPIIAMYNGKSGKYRMKYFFYIFYPLHLVVLYGISIII